MGPDHFWSLAVEEHFYLFWPLLVFYSQPKKLPYVIAAIVSIALILRIVFVQHSFETFYFTLTRMDELALGALVAVFEIRNKLLPSYFRKYFFLFVLLILPLCFVWLWNGSSANPVLQVLKYNFISIIYFLVLCFVLTSGENGLIKRVLRSQSLNFLGRISYGLYVYHPLCFFVYASSFSHGNIALDFFGSFALTVLISTASYYFFERRFLAMKRYFDYNGKIKPVILSCQTQER